MVVGVGGGFAAAGDVGPLRRKGRVEFEPLRLSAFGVGQDRFDNVVFPSDYVDT